MTRIPSRLAAAAAIVLLAGAFAVLPAPLQAVRAQQQQAPATAEGDAAAQRLSQLEEQIVDLQVVVGTLQSLAHRGPLGAGGASGQPGAATPGAADAPTAATGASHDLVMRVDALETQIRALTGQIEQMADRMASLQAQLGGGPATLGGEPGTAPDAGQRAAPLGGGAGAQGDGGLQPPAAIFGTTTVTPGGDQSLGPRPPSTVQGGQAAVPARPGGDSRVASLPSADVKTMYEQAFSHLMQRDFEAAETGFARLIAAYPQDDLAGNAHYWLGETHFARGRYKPAADAFLDSYRLFPTGNKAPDSLLRLGMALSQLGQKQAACDSLSALNTKFPEAPQHVRQKAGAESRRNGC